MKNYEFHKNKLSAGEAICISAFICRHGKSCDELECKKCEFDENLDLSLRILLAEHIDPIKLKSWEYDLIRTNDMSRSRTFGSFNTYMNMKRIGHFAGIKNTSITLEDIVNNCEVIDD